MIRKCKPQDFASILEIINDAAICYKDVIPEDCWHEPYFSADYLEKEISRKVKFFGYEENNALIGVMGIQGVKDVTLIRHAYVLTKYRGKGIGGKLMSHLRTLTKKPILIGTWKSATWAINFYEKHGFVLVGNEEDKNNLLRKYWQIPEKQVVTSVVLKEK